MKKPNGSSPRERTLSDDEIRAVWNGLPTVLARSKTCQRIIKLCLVTAQRLGEVAGMEPAELQGRVNRYVEDQNLLGLQWNRAFRRRRGPARRMEDEAGSDAPLVPQPVPAGPRP